MNVTVNITGNREIQRRLASAPEYYKSKIMDAIKVVAITEIENKAKRSCHVDTGRLRSSLHTIFYRSGSYSYSDNNGNNFNGDLSGLQVPENVVAVGSNVKYARKLERYYPYLFPAFESARPKIQQRIQAVLRTPPP